MTSKRNINSRIEELEEDADRDTDDRDGLRILYGHQLPNTDRDESEGGGLTILEPDEVPDELE